MSSPPRKSILGCSLPPTAEELSHIKEKPFSQLPMKYRRSIDERIFVNRNLRMDSIKYVGFDMDYTMAPYTTEYEFLGYRLAQTRLLQIGYPEEITALKYDPTFPIRGLFLDTKLGNILKCDGFGYIISAVHGKKVFDRDETRALYPNMETRGDEIGKRYFLFDTLFGLPEACLFSDLVDFFERKCLAEGGESLPEGLHGETTRISYSNLFQDVRNSVDFVHREGQIKREVLGNLALYVHKDPRFPVFLHRLRLAGKKVFMLTNSEFYYTDKVMSFLLDGTLPDHKSWRDFFDISIVSGSKPRFFNQGTTLREVNIETGNLGLSAIHEKFEAGKVYAGGNLQLFSRMTGTRGTDVLYIGDNIFHDVVASKKSSGLWRTLLIVPELDHEMKVWSESSAKYNRLQNLEYIRAEVFRGLDSECTTPPNIDALAKAVKDATDELEAGFNTRFGSLFRSGSKTTFFSMQVQRFADLYCSSFLNLLAYPLFYFFQTPSFRFLPHEEEAMIEWTHPNPSPRWANSSAIAGFSPASAAAPADGNGASSSGSLLSS